MAVAKAAELGVPCYNIASGGDHVGSGYFAILYVCFHDFEVEGGVRCNC